MQVCYVYFDVGEAPSKLFDQVVWAVDPPLVKDGGVSLANVVITTPDGASFFAIEMGGGNLADWQAQIEQGALVLGRLTAKASRHRFDVSDGRSYALPDCRVDHKGLAR
jgi:hypothetical protein